MTLPIAQLGQPVLREPALPVAEEEIKSPDFQQFLDEMIATLDPAQGVGLAGPQVFRGQRVFLAQVLANPDPEEPALLEVFINPKLTATATQKGLAWEGCLSFPELLVLVPRHKKVRVEYLDRQGEMKTLELEGFPARVVQHENDHLDGILTLDRAISLRHIVKTSEIKDVMASPEFKGLTD